MPISSEQLSTKNPLGKGRVDRLLPFGSIAPSFSYPYFMWVYEGWHSISSWDGSAVPSRTKHETGRSFGGLSVDFVRGAFPN